MKPAEPRGAILVVTREYQPEIVGGLGVVATAQSRGLVKAADRSVVVVTTTKRLMVGEEGSGPRVFRFPLGGKFYKLKQGFNVKRVGRFLATRLGSLWPPSLVQVHSVQGAGLARYLQSTYRIPVVYTSHSVVMDEIGRNLALGGSVLAQQEELYRLADLIICGSRRESEKIAGYYPWTAGRLTVVPNGIEFRPPARRKANGRGFLLYVGRLAKVKGLVTLLQAMPSVLKAWPGARLHLVGQGSSKYERLIKREIRRLKIGRSVTMHGFIDRDSLSDFYLRADLAIMPSYSESFGLVALEALNWGTPLVASDVGGLAEILEPEVAVKVPPRDAGRLAEAILRVLRHPDQARAMASRGRDLVRTYDWPVVNEELWSVLRGLIHGSQVKPCPNGLR